MKQTHQVSAMAENFASSASFKDDLIETLAPLTLLLVSLRIAGGVSSEVVSSFGKGRATSEKRWNWMVVNESRWRISRRGISWGERKWGRLAVLAWWRSRVKSLAAIFGGVWDFGKRETACSMKKCVKREEVRASTGGEGGGHVLTSLFYLLPWYRSKCFPDRRFTWLLWKMEYYKINHYCCTGKLLFF